MRRQEQILEKDNKHEVGQFINNFVHALQKLIGKLKKKYILNIKPCLWDLIKFI